MTSGRLAPAYRFEVSFAPSPGTGPGAPLGPASFSEIGGLDVEMDVAEYAPGGRNQMVIQRAGRAKITRLTLKRGMVYGPGGSVEPAFWKWLADCVNGVRPLRRYDVTIRVMVQEQAVATWLASRAVVAKLIGPRLNAVTGDVAMEELQLAHESLTLVTP